MTSPAVKGSVGDMMYIQGRYMNVAELLDVIPSLGMHALAGNDYRGRQLAIYAHALQTYAAAGGAV